MDVELAGRVAVVTGGGGGIGAALVRRLIDQGAKVVAADLDGAAVRTAVEAVEKVAPGSAVAVEANVATGSEIQSLISRAEEAFGPVDLYFANAGIDGPPGNPADDEWERTIEINLMAHIRAARLLVPGWLERGEGYFVSTASAAGLLTQIGLAPYSVTKHGAVAFAEWLAVTYGGRGIRVSCLCPMGVDTNMLNAGLDREGEAGVAARVVAAAGDVLSPQEVADRVVATIDAEKFLILPHPEVLEFLRRKSSDYDRWIAGMQRLQARVEAD